MDSLLGTLVGGLITIFMFWLTERSQAKARREDRSANLRQTRLQLQWQDELACLDRRRAAARRLSPLMAQTAFATSVWLDYVRARNRTDADQARMKDLGRKLDASFTSSTVKLVEALSETAADLGPELSSASHRVLQQVGEAIRDFGLDTSGLSAAEQAAHEERKAAAMALLQSTMNDFRAAVAALASPLRLNPEPAESGEAAG